MRYSSTHKGLSPMINRNSCYIFFLHQGIDHQHQSSILIRVKQLARRRKQDDTTQIILLVNVDSRQSNMGGPVEQLFMHPNQSIYCTAVTLGNWN